MSELSKKDVEILNLKAARMSSASIAMMVGWSEAKVYNRLNGLEVYSAGDALERLAGRPAFSLAGWSRIGDENLTLLMGALARAAAEVATASPPPVIHVAPPVAGQIEQLYVGGVEYVPAAPAPPAPAVVRVEPLMVEPRPAPPRSATRRPRAVAPSPKVSTVVAAAAPCRPTPVVPRSQPMPPSSPRGGLSLKSVSPRIATWAGHFRRARWSVSEVAHLFDVTEDDLALALGEAA